MRIINLKIKKNYCIDCGKEICLVSLRCKSCARKGELNPNYGKSPSEETKNKLSKSLQGYESYWKGKKLPENIRKKISKTLSGRHLSEEHRQKIREGMNKLEVKKRMSESHKNKHFTKEHRQKISKALKGIRRSEETRKKMIEANKKKYRDGVYDNRLICYPNIKYKKKDETVIYLDSSWELKVAQDLDKNNIKWLKPNSKNGHIFQWIDKNEEFHTYHPDFFLPEYKVYLEPHAFWRNDEKGKLEFKDKIESVHRQNDIKILILNKNELDWKSIYEYLYKK